jgi:hypothetical protein
MFAWFAAAMATDGLGLASINPIAASSLIGFGTPPPDVEINFSIVDFHGIEDDTIPYNESTSSGIFKKIPTYLLIFEDITQSVVVSIFVNAYFLT